MIAVLEEMLTKGLFFVAFLVITLRTEDYSCPKGKFLHPLKYVCADCTVCQPGQYIWRPCEGIDDTDCLDCPPGTFSTDENRIQCRNCTVCEHGKASECNGTSDTVCLPDKVVTPDPPTRTSYSGWVLGLVCVVATAILFVAVFVMVRQWRHRRHRERRRAGQGDGESDAMNQSKCESDL